MRYFMKAQFSRRQMLRLGAVGIGGLLAGGLPTLRTEASTSTPTLAESMTSAAEAYLDTLDEAAKKQTSFASTDSERYRWHWTTPDRFPRAGVPLGQLTSSAYRSCESTAGVVRPQAIFWLWPIRMPGAPTTEKPTTS
jgi:hypothetical protein